MMFCHSILRKLFGDYTMSALGKSQEYVKLLRMINDNADGREGPFSI